MYDGEERRKEKGEEFISPPLANMKRGFAFYKSTLYGTLILFVATAGSFVAAFSANEGRVSLGVGGLERCTKQFGCVEWTSVMPSRRSFVTVAGASMLELVVSPSLSNASEEAIGKVILNNGRAESSILDDPLALVDNISELYNQIQAKCTQNGLVDYVSIGTDEDFPKLEKEMTKLQSISLKDMDTGTKMAFVINLYNTMIRIAFATTGIPKNDLTRLSFFDTVAVNVGGDIFTFNDLENGILRANSVPPYHFTKPFGNGDSRAGFALSETDPRIHFALNCGAKSCPPVRRYTVRGLQEELTAAAIAFCEDDSNVLVDESKRELRVSKIFKWYSGDFSTSKGQIPLQILKHLIGKKKALLEQLVQNGNLAVDFVPYDWTTNDSRSQTFG